MALLEASHISKRFQRGNSSVTAVDGVSIAVDVGETLGIIGESGAGKSTLGRIVVALLPPDEGRVDFDGVDLTSLSPGALRRMRAAIQVVFQEPFESLDPRMRVADIVREPLDIHRHDLALEERRERVHEALRRVGLREDLWRRKPAQLSGGEQQRVGIARATICQPRLLLLDEPTSSLDLSLRAGILQLLLDLQRERHLAYLFVSHDMTTVEYMSSRVAVMYKGRIIEEGRTEAILNSPRHPYTRLLMDARLATDPRQRREQRIVARPAPASGSGCIFYERCPIAADACAVADVPMLAVGGDGHRAACLLAGEGPGGRSLGTRPLRDDGRPEPAPHERGNESAGGFVNAEAVANAEADAVAEAVADAEAAAQAEETAKEEVT